MSAWSPSCSTSQRIRADDEPEREDQALPRQLAVLDPGVVEIGAERDADHLAMAPEHAVVARVVEQLALDVAQREHVGLRAILHVDELGGHEVLDVRVRAARRDRREPARRVQRLVGEVGLADAAILAVRREPPRQGAPDRVGRGRDVIGGHAATEVAQHVQVIEREHLVLVDERARLTGRAREPVVRVGEPLGDRSAEHLGAAGRLALVAWPGERAAQRGRADRRAGEPGALADRADDERGRGRAIARGQVGIRGEHVVEARVRDQAREHVVVVRADRGAQVVVVAGDRGRER